jgi:hypothetical protein
MNPVLIAIGIKIIIVNIPNHECDLMIPSLTVHDMNYHYRSPLNVIIIIIVIIFLIFKIIIIVTTNGILIIAQRFLFGAGLATARPMAGVYDKEGKAAKGYKA